MNYIQRLRRRYRNLSDREFERFLRLAAANRIQEIPAVYRSGFELVAPMFQNQRPLTLSINTSNVSPYPEPTAAEMAAEMQRMRRQENLRLAEEIRAAEAAAFNQMNPALRTLFQVWEAIDLPFKATGTLGMALLVNPAIAASPFYGGSIDDRGRRLMSSWQMMKEMGTDLFYSFFTGQDQLLDPEDYYTKAMSEHFVPDIREKIRRGEQNPYFDVVKATIIKTDGTKEERWIAPYEEYYLRRDPSVLSIMLDESTRKPNTDRINIPLLGEFNKHYLLGFGGSAVGDISNFATMGSGVFLKGMTRPLSALDDALRILKANPVKGALGLTVDALTTPYIAPFAFAGRALGFGVRRLPSVAEKAMQHPILRNPIVQSVHNALDGVSSIFLPFFYNLENRGVKPSTILHMIRPLYDMTKETRQAFVREAPQKVERVMAEWGSEGADFSDESWDFIKTVLNIKEDVPMGSRKEWIAKNGKMQDLAHTMTLWNNPHPVIQNFADYWEAWKPAAQAWRAGLHAKQLFENIGFTKQSDWRRVLYPIVRLWDENQATMEEVGRQVRQAQQAIIDKQGDTAIAFTKALTGNPEFEQTDLGRAVREHQEAVAKLQTAVPSNQKERYLKLMGKVLDEAGIAITDESSATRLLDLFSSIVSGKRQDDAFSLALQSPEAAHQYLRSKGILTQSPEHSHQVMQLLNSREAKAIMGDLMKKANQDEYMDALRKYNQTVVELRRHGLSPKMAAGLENIYYTMRTIYDTMTPEQRVQFQQEFGRLTTALMTGQVFDPRELRSFYKWMDDNNISATVRETVENVLEHAANKSLLEPFVAAQANRLKPGMVALMRELDRQKHYRRMVERINQQIKQAQDVDPCL